MANPSRRPTTEEEPVAPLDRPSHAPPSQAIDPGEDDHGRIGYGRYGRFTPLALAALLVIGLLAIGIRQRGTGDPAEDAKPAALVGKPAPDVALTLLDGTPWRLADRRGSVVVVNFWASWCAPCKDEAPALQSLHETDRGETVPVAVVGVGVRFADGDQPVADFVRELGLTYPIGRDTGDADPLHGPVERAFGIAPNYPTTVFVRPDGIVAAVHLGPLDAEQLGRYVADAARV